MSSLTLGRYTSPRLMIPELQNRDAAGIVVELCTALKREGSAPDMLALVNSVMNRERLSSTAIAPGWALPHGRLAGLPQLHFALGRCPQPLKWFQGSPVRMVFLFAVPEFEAATYLTLISALARLSQDAGRTEQLIRAPDPETMFEILDQVHTREPRAMAHSR